MILSRLRTHARRLIIKKPDDAKMNAVITESEKLVVELTEFFRDKKSSVPAAYLAVLILNEIHREKNPVMVGDFERVVKSRHMREWRNKTRAKTDN